MHIILTEKNDSKDTAIITVFPLSHRKPAPNRKSGGERSGLKWLNLSVSKSTGGKVTEDLPPKLQIKIFGIVQVIIKFKDRRRRD